MSVALTTIQAALIARIASQVTSLSSKRVKAFSGTVSDFLSAGTKTFNLPFCGVALRSGEPENGVVTNSIFEEHYTFSLMLIAEDARGQEFSNVGALKLVDAVRNSLIGHTLSGCSGVAPLEIGPLRLSEEAREYGTTAYELDVMTYQVIQ